mgnify:CR=1 FL=1
MTVRPICGFPVCHKEALELQLQYIGRLKEKQGKGIGIAVCVDILIRTQHVNEPFQEYKGENRDHNAQPHGKQSDKRYVFIGLPLLSLSQLS